MDRSRVLIVVPCYNEADRLARSAFVEHAAAHEHVLLLVNDGSTDATGDVLKQLHEAHPQRLLTMDLPHNMGKAEAVRQGMRQVFEQPGVNRYDFVGFWDADLATPLASIDLLLSVFERSDDIEMVFGSRVLLMGRHISRSALRHYLGRFFATFASLTLGLPVYDTQCGAKIFKVTPALCDILKEPFLSRWIFDVELIARWLKLHGNDAEAIRKAHRAIYEQPLPQWINVAGSKVRPRDFVRAMLELWHIHRRYGSHGNES